MSDERKSHMSSIIGETAVVIGNVSGHGDLEIRGKVQGSIELIGRVLIAEGGIVLGNIEAGTITVSGEVRGDLSASDGIVIQASGEVEGNLLAPRVGVEPGARVRGMLRTGTTSSAPEGTNQAVSPPKNTVATASAPILRDDPAPVEDRRAAVTKAIEAPDTSSEEAAAPVAALEKSDRARKRRRPKKPGPAVSTASSEGNKQGEDSAARTTTSSVKSAASPAKSAPPPAAIESSRKPDDRKPTKSRQKGPPKPPTFTKGAKGHQRG